MSKGCKTNYVLWLFLCMEEKMEEQNKTGILISLEKRMPMLAEGFEENYKYVVFGHYDGMNIKVISQWGEFRPATVADYIANGSGKKSAQEFLNDGIYDRYIIRGCYPHNLKSLKDKYKLRYDIWEEDFEDEEFPFVSCVMFHLMKSCIKMNSKNNSIDDIFVKVAKFIENSSVSESLKYSIYFSVGYSDVIILARTKGIGDISILLDQFYDLEVLTREKLISDVYTMTGYERSVFSDTSVFKKQNWGNPMSYSISFVLKAGFSLECFRKSLKIEIEKVFSKLGYEYDFDVLKNKNIFATFGNADVILRFTCPDRIFPALYAAENVLGFYAPFHIKSEFYKKYITSINVSVLCDDTNKTNATNLDIKRLRKMELQNQEKYNKFLERLAQSAKVQNLPYRMVAAIAQIIKTYSILIAPDHGFEVEQLIGAAIDAFIANMDLSLERLKEVQGLDRSVLISDIERAVGKFRDYIETYLSDLYRSDKSFMEGRTMTHQAIGSLSKLLFTYNVFINNLAEYSKEKNEKYAFVVVSGGCDRTQVIEIFEYLGAWTPGYHHLFIVAIPEISLFDISGTLFRLSHECHHCFGDRHRIERSNSAKSAWVAYISDRFSRLLFDKDIYSFDLLEPRISSEQLKNNIKDEIERNRLEFYRKFKEKLQNYIVKDDTDEDKNNRGDLKEYYSVNCIRRIRQMVRMNFIVSRDVASPLYSETVKILFDQQIGLLQYIMKNISNNEKIGLREMLSELQYYKDHSEDLSLYDMEDVFSRMLYRLFNSVIDAEQVNMEILLFKKSIGEAYNLKDKEFYVICNMIGNFAETAITMMSECFADCMSANLLGMRIQDFLLAFVYETWDIDKAMPMNLKNILRMGVDLECLFKVSGELPEETRKKVIELKQEYESAGFDLKIDLDKYFIRLNEMLIKYKELSDVGSEMKKYLEVCGIEFLEPNVEKEGDFATFYKKFRNPAEAKENIYMFLNYWRELAGKSWRKRVGKQVMAGKNQQAGTDRKK